MVSNVTSLPGFSTVNLASTSLRSTEEGRSQRLAEPGATSVDVAADRYAAGLVAAREEIFAASGVIDLSVAQARQARPLLVEARDLAQRAAAGDAPEAALTAQNVAFRGVLQQFGRAIDAAVENGATLLSGANLSLRPDPAQEERLVIAGADLQLKARPAPDDPVQLTQSDSIDTPEKAAKAARAADETLRRLDAHVQRLEGARDGLDGHDRVLAALRSAIDGDAADLTADGARLLALQVRQSLAELSGPIANADTSRVLAHFRAG